MSGGATARHVTNRARNLRRWRVADAVSPLEALFLSPCRPPGAALWG